MYKKSELRKEITNLKQIREGAIDKLNGLRSRVPRNMRLRGAKHGNTYQYFLRPAGTIQNGTYIKKNNYDLAQDMAMTEYYENLLEEISGRLLELEGIFDELDDNIYLKALNKMPESKRALVKVPYVSDEDALLEWLQQDFEKMGFRENTPEFYTRKGMRVRSKTEVIIADMLEEMAIPFLYEKPLELKSGTVHPDFTLFDPRSRKEVYWEHFGMMDDVEYRNNAFMKIRKYEESGLFQHDSLIWTFETSKYQINTKLLRKMVVGLGEKFCSE